MHFPRSLSITALTTFALTAAGTPLAQGATATGPGSAHTAVSRPRPGTVTLPAQGLDRFPDLLNEQRRHGDAAQTSSNWSGYAATGGTYTSVSSSWVEPSVSCSATGTVAFWVGLDGLGSGSVEQTGTAVDCSTGSPRSFAWWETYPANSVQQYRDPVSAGDRLTSTVTAESDGRYDLVLTDSTRGWTENNVVAGPAGASNASAEIIAEAVSNGFGITPLPNFDSVRFTGSTMNSDTLQASGAQGITMTSDTGAVVATTSAADSSGDFTVDYDGGSGITPEPPESIFARSPHASDFLDTRL